MIGDRRRALRLTREVSLFGAQWLSRESLRLRRWMLELAPVREAASLQQGRNLLCVPTPEAEAPASSAADSNFMFSSEEGDRVMRALLEKNVCVITR